MTEKLAWAKRAKVIKSEVSVRKQWLSEGGRYALEHSKFHHPDLRPEWRLLGLCQGCSVLVVLSHHRTRGGAEKAAEKHRSGA